MMTMRCLLAGFLLLLALPAVAGEETVELIPDDRAGWSAFNLFAPIGGLLRGNPDYWYEPRSLRIDTTPPGAILDLFYVRSNFQKGYEQADAPVRVLLPSRIEAGPRDTILVRAILDGFRQREVRVPVRSARDEVMIDLDPLPNALLALSHVSMAGRASLGFLTKEALSFRVQKAGRGFQVVLNQTALSPEAADQLDGVQGALIEALSSQQLGEDLVVRVALQEAAQGDAIEPRSRQSFDPVRGLHSFSLDLAPPDGGADAVERARAALARIGPDAVEGCAAEWDRTLRQQLDPAALSRALAARGAFTDPYLRAAMRRLGEVSPGGEVRLTDGTRFAVAAPIELMAAATQAHEVLGYLALLRRFVAELEPAPYRRESLRGLVAPEVAPSRFGAMVDAADAREAACRGAT
jgi:hypothetical protein